MKTIRIGGGASADADGRNSKRTSPEGATPAPATEEMGEEVVDDVWDAAGTGMSAAMGLSSSRDESDSSSPQWLLSDPLRRIGENLASLSLAPDGSWGVCASEMRSERE